MQDPELLQAYVREGNQEAFRTLVERHAGLVYSTAVRQVRDPHLAQDVVQRTFMLLARRAPTLCHHTALIGWLYRAACLNAAELQRSERRRHLREEAFSQMAPAENDKAWNELEPLLDLAMNKLGERDRLAILTRFFEGRSMQEVGRALGVGEDAAKMRISRALDKLRSFFKRKGIVCSVSTLAVLLETRANGAAPPTLIGTICAGCTATSAGSGFAPLALIHSIVIMSTGSLPKIAATVAVLLGVIGVGTYLHLRSTFPTSPSEARPRTFDDRLGISQPPGSTSEPARHEATVVDPWLAQALDQLREALYTPATNSYIPYERVASALARFGSERKRAVPLLLGALAGPDLTAQVLGARGLAELKSDASDAIPEMLRLLKDNRLAVLNEEVVELFLAVHPQPDIVPELLPLLGQSQLLGRAHIADLIASLLRQSPSEGQPYKGELVGLLQNEDADTRLYAASALSQIPGEKPAGIIDELTRALNLEGLRDPHFYDPVVNKESHTTYLRDAEKLFDNGRRFEAVRSLASIGPDAKGAISDLQSLAGLTDNVQLRNSAMQAIGAIDPAARDSDAHLDRLLSSAEEGKRLAQVAQSGTATLDDLIQGLGYEGSVGAAAKVLDGMNDQAKPAIPALDRAVQQWASYSAARILARFAPERLLGDLQTASNPNVLGIIAQVLAEQSAAPAGAVPLLQKTLEKVDPQQIGVRAGLADAITKLDRTAPKPIFGWDDLWPAVNAMMTASEKAGGQIFRNVQNLEIRQFQDLNQKTRGEVLSFADDLGKLDRNIQGTFVAKLIQYNPDLQASLQPASHSGR